MIMRHRPDLSFSKIEGTLNRLVKQNKVRFDHWPSLILYETLGKPVEAWYDNYGFYKQDTFRYFDIDQPPQVHPGGRPQNAAIPEAGHVPTAQPNASVREIGKKAPSEWAEACGRVAGWLAGASKPSTGQQEIEELLVKTADELGRTMSEATARRLASALLRGFRDARD
jgi:hypothetical protein